jgi:hypothetical protein
MLRAVLHALVVHLLWQLPIAEPFDPPLPRWWSGGRVVTVPGVRDSDPDRLHIGVRPAADLGDMGIGVTIQVTTSLVP